MDLFPVSSSHDFELDVLKMLKALEFAVSKHDIMCSKDTLQLDKSLPAIGSIRSRV